MATLLKHAVALALVLGPCCSPAERINLVNKGKGKTGKATAKARAPGDGSLRLAIVGLTGDGKSSLCNWLLGKEGAFKVSAKTDSETKDVKVAEGHLFGDSSYPKIMIADTPGLADTKGEDATLWQNAVQDLRTNFKGEIDLMLWVVNGAGSRWSEDRQAMIETQRFTFGYKYWKHMAVIFTHWPTKVSDDDPTGNSKEAAVKKAGEWKAKLVESDASYFANGMASEDITHMPMYFVDLAEDLSTRFFQRYQGSWADAKTAVAWTYDADGAMTYQKSGMTDLTSLAKDLMSQVASPEYEALDISDATPRMGPGEVDEGQEFTCFFPGDQRCVLPLRGTHMGDVDEVRLLLGGTQCGAAPQQASAKAGLQFTQQRSRVDGTPTERFFDFGELLGEHAIGTFEVCYCEAGHCADDRRFAQHAGQLHVKWSGCALPQYKAAAADPMPADPLLPRLASQVFTCAEGHTTLGQPGDSAAFTVVCDPSAEKRIDEWIQCSTPPCQCLTIHCAVSASEAQEPASAQAVVAFGKEVEYKCRPGFTTDAAGAVIEGASYTTSCLADGTTGPQRCVPVTCGEVPTRAFATSDMANTAAHFGQTVTFSCAAGFSTDGYPAGSSTQNGQFQMSCGATGNFEPATPAQECVPVSCGSVEQLRALPGATSTKPTEVVKFPDAAPYKCNVGHVARSEDGKLTTTVSRRCRPDGTFEPSEGCAPMECSVSTSDDMPSHAQLLDGPSSLTIKYGEKFKYRCDPKHSLNGLDLGRDANFQFEHRCEAGEFEGVLAKPKVECKPVNSMPEDPAYVIACGADGIQLLGTTVKPVDCTEPRVVCAAGYAGSAVVTPTKEVDGKFGLSGCEPCAPGTFARSPGMEKCAACPTNMYQSEAGQRSCVPCPEGLVTSTHQFSVNASDCVDISKHRCCCTQDNSCALVAPMLQKSQSGHIPTWWAEWQGGHCPQLDFDQYCATWGKYAGKYNAVPATNKEGSCTPGDVAVVDWKCHKEEKDAKKKDKAAKKPKASKSGAGKSSTQSSSSTEGWLRAA